MFAKNLVYFKLINLLLLVSFNGISAECINLCNINPFLNFRLSKDGFHRELDISVEITLERNRLWNSYQIVFEQTIPSGAYVNPDELSELRRMNKIMACPVGNVNIESPEHDSLHHNVHIYADLQHFGSKLAAEAKLPVHLRYHSPTYGGSPATVILEPPVLLLRSNCSSACGQRREAPCQPYHQDICEWFSVPYKSDTTHISITVPVGNLNHANLVTVITLVVTIASAVYLLKTVLASVKVAASRKKK